MFNSRKETNNQIKILEDKYYKLLTAQTENADTISKMKTIIENLNKRVAFLEEQIKNSSEKTNQKEYNDSGFAFTEDQAKALNLLETTKENYLITGRAGTGKSTVLKEFVRRNKDKKIAVVAFTGFAALNVGGQTIHSLFHLSLDPQDVNDTMETSMPGYVEEVLKNLDILVIDEISMVRSDIMDMMNKKLCIAKKNDYPFGGCRIIAFVDMYQLAPVAKTDDEKSYIVNKYGTLYFFGSDAARGTFKIIELNEVVRQKNESFIALLNKIRIGDVGKETLAMINKTCTSSIPDNWIHLTLKRKTAETINQHKLDQINSKEYIFNAELGGVSPPSETDAIFEYCLHLKVGAIVMTIMNDLSSPRRYVNGTVGVVQEIRDDCVVVQINGEPVPIGISVWDKKKYTYNRQTKQLTSEVVGWGKQYPLRLAYAITVHKSQGQTYDHAVIDFAGASVFSAGQAYVAISRCRTLEGIRITRSLTPEDIYINPEVPQYLNGTWKHIQSEYVDFDSEELPF